MVAKALQNQYDCALLISGDDDFCKAVEYVKNCGKRVVLYYFEKGVGSRLRRTCDSFTDLEPIIPEILQIRDRKV